MLASISIDEPVLAVSYIQHSTKRQAVEGASLDEQRRANAAEAARLGYKIVAEYMYASGSGRSNRRPEFQRMILECCSKDSSVKTVFVHIYSRFHPDANELEDYRLKLTNAGVRLLCPTFMIGTVSYAK